MSIKVNYSNGKLCLAMTDELDNSYDIYSTDDLGNFSLLLTDLSEILSKKSNVDDLKNIAKDPILHSGLHQKKWLGHVEREIGKYFKNGGDLEGLPSLLEDELSVFIDMGDGDERVWSDLSYKRSKKFIGNGKDPANLTDFKKHVALENFRMFVMEDSENAELIKFINSIKKDVNYKFVDEWQESKDYPLQYYAERIVKESSFLNKNKEIMPVDDNMLSLSGFYRKVSIAELSKNSCVEVFGEKYGTSEEDQFRILSTIFRTVNKYFDGFECRCHFPFPSSLDRSSYVGHIHTNEVWHETRHYLFSGINKKTGHCEALCFWTLINWYRKRL